MPRIFDNIERALLPALLETLSISEHADFCVGYFNLRGWKSIDKLIEDWAGGTGWQCRLLVGMQRLPQEDLREAYSLLPNEDQMSNQVVIRLKRRLAEEFRAQLTIGAKKSSGKHLSELVRRLMGDLEINAIRKRAVSQMTGAVEYDEFWSIKSKSILDEIDTVLARHYGFTPEELDFILNYDIKYRLGRGTENETED